jgi:hypothetical protein
VIGLISGLLALAIIYYGMPLMYAAPPGIIAAAIFWLSAPAVAAFITVFCVGTYGTVQAYFPVPTVGLAEVLLVGLAGCVIWLHVAQTWRRRVHVVPAILLIVIYVAISAFALIDTPIFNAAFTSFKGTGGHMLTVVLLALAPWPPATFRRVAIGILAAAVIIAAYCGLRYFVGSSSKEMLNARLADAGPWLKDLRFFGSFPAAPALAAWCVAVLPLALSIALAWRGRWRLVAGGVAGAIVLLLLASDVRTGLLAGAIGAAAAGALFVSSRAFPSGRRLATGSIAVIAAVGISVPAYLIAVAPDQKRSERFASLFDPGSDRNYQVRQTRWDAAWDEVVAEPLGHGLGRAGIGIRQADTLPVGPVILDSSYLKIGIEQGLAVLVFFVLILVVLLATLAWRAVTTTDPLRATLAIAGAGTVAGLAVLFWGSTYIEAPPVIVGWLVIGLGLAQVTLGDQPRRGTPG